MSTSLQQFSAATLTSTACRVLETAAFAFAERALADDLPGVAAGHVATLRLSGDLRATLTVAAPAELCQALSGDMVGEEPDEMSMQQAADVLGEMGNMIAGQLATDLLGEDSIVYLTPPELERFDAELWQALVNQAETVLLLVDDQPLLLLLEPEVAPANS